MNVLHLYKKIISYRVLLSRTKTKNNRRKDYMKIVNSRRNGLTLTELLIIVGIIILVVSLTIPVLLETSAMTNRDLCIKNLREIQGQKEWMLYTMKNTNLLSLSITNSCPKGGKYTVGDFSEDPTCSFQTPKKHLLHKLPK